MFLEAEDGEGRHGTLHLPDDLLPPLVTIPVGR